MEQCNTVKIIYHNIILNIIYLQNHFTLLLNLLVIDLKKKKKESIFNIRLTGNRI